MFDLDPSSRRARLALRFFTYGVMTVSTIVISTIMVFFALGYRLDNNFHFTQGGLVQLLSTPNNASVTVDDVRQGFHTPDKMNMSAGQHTVTMSLDGYRTWNKTFTLAPGQLLWLNYARLIPTTVTTSTVRDFDSLASALPSPDHHWVLLQAKANLPDFTLVDISDEKTPKFTQLQLPDSELSKKDGAYGVFSLVEWDDKSQFVLVKHQLGDTTEFIRMDRSKPAEAVNITRMFGFAIMEAHFAGSNANAIFANTSGVLRRLDIGSKSASGVLVNNLQQFSVYDERSVAFTAEQEQTSGDATTKQHVLGTWRNDKATIIRTAALSMTFTFAYGDYDNHEYLAYNDASNATITLLRDPSTSATKENAVFATFDLGAKPEALTMSGNSRIVVAQQGNRMASYDIEEAKSYQKLLDLGSATATKLQWLDDFYLWTDAGGTLRFVEFDGTNQQDITNVQPGFGLALSSNGKRLFTVDKDTSGKLLFQSSRLTVGD